MGICIDLMGDSDDGLVVITNTKPKKKEEEKPLPPPLPELRIIPAVPLKGHASLDKDSMFSPDHSGSIFP